MGEEGGGQCPCSFSCYWQGKVPKEMQGRETGVEEVRRIHNAVEKKWNEYCSAVSFTEKTYTVPELGKVVARRKLPFSRAPGVEFHGESIDKLKALMSAVGVKYDQTDTVFLRKAKGGLVTKTT